MQLNNVLKKVGKASADLGIAPDEEIRAACTTNPKGTMTRMMAKELGGAVAVLAAGRGSSTSTEPPPGGGLSERFPAGQHYVVVTDRRLLVCTLTLMTGRPKEVVAEWPIAEVLGIVTEKGRLAIPLTIAFADGSAVCVEAARGTGGDTLAPAFDSLTV